MIALDASALLAFLFREAGHERVAAEIETACCRRSTCPKSSAGSCAMGMMRAQSCTA